jgi:CRISPR-associated protein (Cas_Cas02710)
MEHLFLQWIKDPTGAVYELFNRSIFYIIAPVAGWFAGYLWAKAKYKVGQFLHHIRHTHISYDGEAYNGLILTLGSSNELQKMIIDQVKPEFVGIITGNSEAVKFSANDLKDYLTYLKIQCDEPRLFGELDVDRIEKGFDDIIEWMIDKGIEKKNIVIDLTGGKTPFSLAAFNSARRNGVNAVYTDSDYDLGKLKTGTQKSILLAKALDD